MKRVSKLTAVPSILCFIGWMLWDEQIWEFNRFLYFVMVAIIGIGFVSVMIQLRRDREATIAKNAVAKFKEEQGLADD